jgi:hypothetical protein
MPLWVGGDVASDRYASEEGQAIAAGVEEAQFLEVGQDGPGSAVLEGVVDGLLFSGRTAGGHAGQGHLARGDDV